VPLFESSIVQVQSTIGTTSALVWNPENGSTVTFGAYGSVPSTATLKDVIVQNTGTTTVYIGSGSLSAGGSTTPLQIPVGGYVLVSGYSVTNPSGSTGQIWGNTTSGTGSTLAGMASLANVVV
jgi:hypothetical protein